MSSYVKHFLPWLPASQFYFYNVIRGKWPYIQPALDTQGEQTYLIKSTTLEEGMT